GCGVSSTPVPVANPAISAVKAAPRIHRSANIAVLLRPAPFIAVSPLYCRANITYAAGGVLSALRNATRRNAGRLTAPDPALRRRRAIAPGAAAGRRHRDRHRLRQPAI